VSAPAQCGSERDERMDVSGAAERREQYVELAPPA
jgi:hypothetical protein